MKKVRIPQSIVTTIVGHARASLPREACGLLYGQRKDGVVIVARATATDNADSTDPNRRFAIAPKDLLEAHKVARAEGIDIVGHYHSHPTGLATPSNADVSAIADPMALWIIVGLSKCGQGEVKAFLPVPSMTGFKQLVVDVVQD